jgi:hypothetical protein
MAASWFSKPKSLLAGLLIVSAAILALLRLSDLTVTRPASEIVFSNLNNLEWDPGTGRLEPTGEDPHAFLEVPESTVPLLGIVMEFSGPLPPGPSYVYPSPAHFPGLRTSDATVITGKVIPVPGGFQLSFEMPPSRLARFDLPDQLHGAWKLRSVTFHTHFAGSTNTVFSLFAGVCAALAGLLLWSLFGPVISRRRGLELACAAVLVLGKLWLASDLHLSIFPDAMHDDALFMSLGHSIANGDWLGKFGELTLSKGPTFPIFIALVQLTRIPFLQAEAGLHAVACLLFILALRPLVRSAGMRLGLLAILLYDPHTLSAQVVAQVLRSGIQPALTLLTLAGFIGVVARVREQSSRVLPWAVLGGVALAAFWYSREEGVWLVPSVALLTGAGAWIVWTAGRKGRLARLALLSLPIGIWFCAQTTLKAINHHYYGAWITIDVKEGGYPEAYAALLRITPSEANPGVPVTKETRLRAYEVSPAFAELRSSLEGQSGNAWAKNGWEGSTHPSAGKEIKGWFQWALRQAAREKGHYTDAASASGYWQRVANEINAACDDGRLTAGPRRSGFLPRWDSSLWPVLGQSIRESFNIVVRFSDFNPQSPASVGDPERMAFYSRMLHEPPVVEPLPLTTRTHLRIVLYHCYAAMGPLVSLLAFIGLIAAGVHVWRRREHAVELAVLLSIAGGALSLLLIVALVDATSFSTTHAIYLAPATPLLLATWILGIGWALQWTRPQLADLSDAVRRIAAFRQSPLGQRLFRPFALGAFFAVLAVICAMVRQYETRRAIPASKVEFSFLNDVGWDRYSHRLTRAGGDPFVLLSFPGSSVPVRHVSIDFKGSFADTEGHFYVFQYAASSPGTGVDGSTLTDGIVTRHSPSQFTVDWTLQDSKVVRIDLPDFLLQPLEIQEVRLTTGFAWAGSTSFRAMLIFLLAAGVCVLRFSWRASARTRTAIVVVSAIGLVALKGWLAADIPLSVYGSAAHDDALFVTQADSIMHGRWLGDFNEITLSKGPVYSLFLAAVGASGVRMELAQAAFHAVACLALVIALRPLLSSAFLQLLVFGVLLFDPHTLSAEVVGRPLRSGIQPALALYCLAGFIGLLLRVNLSPRRLLGWAIFAGCAFSAFWFCREEGVWLIPSILLLSGAAGFVLFRVKSTQPWLRLGLLVLPFAIWTVSTWTLRLINWHFYDAPISMDVKDGNFPKAYGALVRITPVESIPLVPVSKETRLRAYPFSPAFKELQPMLEGALGDGWSQPGWEGVDHPSAKKEMRGWFQWAIRQAAAQAGHYQTARTANEYWGRVAQEINAACDRGDLPAGPKRSGFFPRWDSSQWRDLRESCRQAFAVVAQFGGFGLHLNPSDGTPEQYAVFARVTHERRFDGHPQPTLARQVRLEVFHLYNAWGDWFTIAAVIATAVIGLQAARRKRHGLLLAILLALLGGAFALSLIVALVDTTAFKAINGSYLSPASPLLLAAWVLAPAWLWATRAAANPPQPTPVTSE